MSILDIEPVKKHYAEAHRHYHTFEHIKWMITVLEAISGPVSKSTTMAVLYHDAVYWPGSNRNEYESCRLYLSEYWKDLRFDNQFVVDAIMATKDHVRSGSSEIDRILDADMAILGSNVIVYQDYMTNIRKEFWAVNPSDYSKGRKAFLTKFYNSGFITKEFNAAFKKQAMKNIEMELEIL